MSDESDLNPDRRLASSVAEQLRPDSFDPRIGCVIDKYRIMHLLGQGGMGSVYEAKHVVLGRRFAIKFLLPEYASNRDVLRRFENEAKSAGSLEHPNIAAVTDLGRAHDDSPYLVMEYLSGQDCAKLLVGTGQLQITRATDIVRQACTGLGVAHQAGIVHRDIKPENLFITASSDGSDLVKILDFGIAKLRLPDASAATGSGVAMGTFYYMAPEQVRDAGKVDARADVWALGVVLYELLTGVKPFDADDAAGIMYKIVFDAYKPPDSLRASLPAPLVAVIDQALAKDPNHRFASVVALADALAPFTGRTSRAPAFAAPSDRLPPPAPGPATGRATTSQASVSILSRPRVVSVLLVPRRTKLVLLSAALVALIVVSTLAVLLKKTSPAHGTAATAGMPNVPSDNAPSLNVVAPSGASTSAPLAVKTGAASAMTASHEVALVVRTTSEPHTPRSNKSQTTEMGQVHASAPAAPSTETLVQPPKPTEFAPERPKSAIRGAVSIDTNSPY